MTSVVMASTEPFAWLEHFPTLVDETCVLLDQRPDAKRARLEWPHEAPVYPVYGDADHPEAADDLLEAAEEWAGLAFGSSPTIIGGDFNRE